MRSKRVLAVIGILAAVLLVGGLAFAGSARRGAGRHGGARAFGRIGLQLDLTDDQRSQIREVVHKHWLSGLGGSADHARIARRDLRGLVQDPVADETAIRQAAKSSAAAEEDFAVERHRTFAEATAVLTPAQQDKLKTLLAERSARGGRIFGGIDGALKN